MADFLNSFSCDQTKTREVAVTSTSQRFAIPAKVSTSLQSYNAVLISNIGTKTAYIGFGDSGFIAVPPSNSVPSLGDIPIPAGAVMILNVMGTNYAVICKSGDTTTINTTFGWGS